MSGATGLNYVPVFAFMDRMNLASDDWMDLFSDLQTLEFTSLATMRGTYTHADT